jgi:Rieske Fe-S protein
MDRRLFLKFVLNVPLLGALVLLASPLFRYLKPTAGPFPHGLVSKPDVPTSVKNVEFSLTDFPEPWTVKEFVYEQRNPEYTRQGAQISKIPGFVLRIPGKSADEYQFVAYSRICPHMGCIFHYVPDPHVATTGFNYTPPKGTPVFACPCHLSVFDPLQEGKVVSGPAPRPPRHFDFKVDESAKTLTVTSLEKGGIA